MYQSLEIKINIFEVRTEQILQNIQYSNIISTNYFERLRMVDGILGHIKVLQSFFKIRKLRFFSIQGVQIYDKTIDLSFASYRGFHTFVLQGIPRIYSILFILRIFSVFILFYPLKLFCYF